MKLGRDVSRHNELDNWRNTHRYESVMATIWLFLTISETDPGLWDRLQGGSKFMGHEDGYRRRCEALPLAPGGRSGLAD